MANEIKVQVGLIVEELDVAFGDGPVLIDLAGTKAIRNKQKIAATEETIDVGDVTTGGYFAAKHNHATAVIEIRPATGETDLVKIGPGDICVFRTSGDATLYAISSVADAELDYVLVEA